MAKNMPTADEALKKFFSDNAVFADLFNSFLFKCEFIKEDELVSVETAYADSVSVNQSKKERIGKITKYRDIARKASTFGNFVILGIENQSEIHHAMPVRAMLYDALEYSKQMEILSVKQEREGWTVDEFLSRISKNTKVIPVITCVFYTGEEPWDGPRCLHDMLDMDDRIKKFVPNYPLNIIDIGHDYGLSFNNKELNELKNILQMVYSNCVDNVADEINSNVISLAGILLNDNALYLSAKKGGKIKMCEALKKRDMHIFAEKDAEIAEKDAEIAEKEAELAEKEAELAEKEAEIAALKAKLS